MDLKHFDPEFTREPVPGKNLIGLPKYYWLQHDGVINWGIIEETTPHSICLFQLLMEEASR